MCNLSITLFERLDTSGRLPTPPGVVLRFLELTRRSDVPVREVAETISMDPMLAAKILRFVNSPMAGVSREVRSLQQAVTLLGVRSVNMMALSLAVVSPRAAVKCTGFDRDEYVMQSLACAAGARIIATALGAPAPQETFAAGLLSQIGRAVLAHGVPDEYAIPLREAKCAPRDLPELERAALGETYASVGGQLLQKWGLPEALCSAIAAFRDEPLAEGVSLPAILNAAEIAACVICPHGCSKPLTAEHFLKAVGGQFGVGRDCGLDMLTDIARDADAVRALLDMPAGRMRHPDEIENDVRERLTELNMAIHLENQTMSHQQADLLRRATTDALTGIGNRAAFDARLQLELDRRARGKAPLALLMIDVDHFKKLNDTYGHQAGDCVLHAVARVLDQSVRKVDYAARYGGEEFAIIAPGTDPAGALLLAERLRDAVAEAAINWEAQELRITVSIGVANSRDTDDGAAAALIRAADEQLYRAKTAGRNRVMSQSEAGPCRPPSARTCQALGA